MLTPLPLPQAPLLVLQERFTALLCDRVPIKRERQNQKFGEKEQFQTGAISLLTPNSSSAGENHPCDAHGQLICIFTDHLERMGVLKSDPWGIKTEKLWLHFSKELNWT